MVEIQNLKVKKRLWDLYLFFQFISQRQLWTFHDGSKNDDMPVHI